MCGRTSLRGEWKSDSSHGTSGMYEPSIYYLWYEFTVNFYDLNTVDAACHVASSNRPALDLDEETRSEMPVRITNARVHYTSFAENGVPWYQLQELSPWSSHALVATDHCAGATCPGAISALFCGLVFRKRCLCQQCHVLAICSDLQWLTSFNHLGQALSHLAVRQHAA